MNKKIFGLMVRYSDEMISGEAVDTIGEHNKLIKKHGIVFLGKLGRYIGESSLKKLNDKKLDRYLILVKNEGKRYVFYRAKVDSALKKISSVENVPAYYKDKEGISVWFCLKSLLVKMSDDQVNEWIIKSSNFSLPSTLSRSMAGFFILAKGTPIDRKIQKRNKKLKKAEAIEDQYLLDDDYFIDESVDLDDLLG